MNFFKGSLLLFVIAHGLSNIPTYASDKSSFNMWSECCQSSSNNHASVAPLFDYAPRPRNHYQPQDFRSLINSCVFPAQSNIISTSKPPMPGVEVPHSGVIVLDRFMNLAGAVASASSNADILQRVSHKIVELKKEYDACWSWQKAIKTTIKNEIAYLEAFCDGTILQLSAEVQSADLTTAERACEKLATMWPWHATNSYQSEEHNPDDFTRLINVHIMKALPICMSLRPERIASLLEHSSQKSAFLQNVHLRDKVFIIEKSVTQELAHSSSHTMVAHNLAKTCATVFNNAAEFGCIVGKDVIQGTGLALNALATAKSPEEFTFYLSVVEQAMADVQMQIATRIGVGESAHNRSSKLLGRLVQAYCKNINPLAATSNDKLPVIVDVARYVWDVTVGKLYLPPETYQARTDTFWTRLAALKNFEQAAVEQAIDEIAEIAADITYSCCMATGIRYLKQISAIARSQGLVARVAQKLVKGVDVLLGRNPVVVTPAGILYKVSGEIAKNSSVLGSSVGVVTEVIKDTHRLVPVLEHARLAGVAVLSFEQFSKNTEVRFPHVESNNSNSSNSSTPETKFVDGASIVKLSAEKLALAEQNSSDAADTKATMGTVSIGTLMPSLFPEDPDKRPDKEPTKTKRLSQEIAPANEVEPFKFSPIAAKHMEEVERMIPVQMLDEIIKNPIAVIKDPRGATDGLMHYAHMWKNGKNYNVEVLYDKATNVISHFKYSQKAMGPLSKMVGS
jgi:hypothetical protein